MSLSFDFSFGKPVSGSPGRWIQGSVIGVGAGYRFTADLMRRHSSTMLQSHRVELDVGRPFRGDDFAAFLRLIGTGTLRTATRLLDLSFPDGLDPSIAASIWEAMMVWVDPWDTNCVLLLKDLTAVADQLEQARKRELLSLAIAKFTQRSGPPTFAEWPIDADGDAN